jgi:cobyrinic acid a,c-diamide synthase
VILNQLGGSRHEAKLRAVIEHYTDVPVLGAVHDDASVGIAERHLGLMPANEAEAAAERIGAIGDAIAAQVDLDRLLARTAAAPLIGAPTLRTVPVRRDVRIGIARDRAFGFYYADDLEALEQAGAVLVPFDTLRDARLPEVDGCSSAAGSRVVRAGAGSQRAAPQSHRRRNRRGHARVRRMRWAHVPCPFADAPGARVPDGRRNSRRRRDA